MTSLFNYAYLSVSFERETRTCNVKILNSAGFKPQVLAAELEKFFDWLTSRVEIYSVVIETQFSDLELLSKDLLKELTEVEVYNYLKTLQRVSYGQLVLPQTITWNVEGVFDQCAFELMAGADFKFISQNFKVSFDSLTKGICSFNGCAINSQLTSSNYYKKVVMSSSELNSTELIESGLVSFIFNEIKFRSHINAIKSQSPITRIQFKRSINDSIIKEMDEIMASELSFSKAALAIGDWKNWAYDQEFHNPREVGRSLKSIPTMADSKKAPAMAN
ncbi:hypothetical protein [Bacteriovorax sp. Seq25_V]|uniref:hypothetical protein n=1 Tax=Bacteriovorax sp. Seq25_V TaxID=1201288 RepID=UPI000389E178|nr:hypothetical protein [Bacteriovorax sp. Seq25_V]EQC44924.1 hypothetical protein M900_A0105 [Bacteriovorax sp. Seq25_V]